MFRYHYYLLVFLLSSFVECAYCQLTSETNMIRIGDSISCHRIEYFSPGGMGENQIWDFRDLEFLDDSDAVHFTCDSDSVMIFGLTPIYRQKYIFQNDSLLMPGYETRLQTMDYSEPLTLFAYPCHYGYNTRQNFHGSGTYCKKYAIESQGIMETDADATGMILYNADDTLHNVLRIHRIYTSGVCQYLPSARTADTLNVRQRIEEHYLWYARGYRYPVFETVSTTVFDDLTPVSCQQTAYCTSPSEQRLLGDSVNYDILLSDSLVQSLVETAPPILYQVSVNGNQVEVSYTAETDVTVHALVSDRMGLVYQRATSSCPAGGHASLLLNCNGLKQGVYILYLNVNGRVFSEKIDL